MAVDMDLLPGGLAGVNSKEETATVIVSEGKPFRPEPFRPATREVPRPAGLPQIPGQPSVLQPGLSGPTHEVGIDRVGNGFIVHNDGEQNVFNKFDDLVEHLRTILTIANTAKQKDK